MIALDVSTRRGCVCLRGATWNACPRAQTLQSVRVCSAAGDARSPWRAGTSQRLGDDLQTGTNHCTSGVLSGPLTGSLLHSLSVNLGALEKSERARNLIFVCRALSAKASLPAVAPRRSAFQWPDRALAHGVPGGRCFCLQCSFLSVCFFVCAVLCLALAVRREGPNEKNLKIKVTH